MIFAGDVAICAGDAFSFQGFPVELLASPWCLNLEGAIDDSSSPPAWGVTNHTSWIDSFRDFHLGPVFLANNHILDVPGGITSTRAHLQRRGIVSFGAGQGAAEAARIVELEVQGFRYALIGCGWEVIGCRPAGGTREGVNRLEGRAVRKYADKALQGAADRVVVVIHGNYEFELYPQPAHRKLAHQLVDAGVHAVVFHHPHIVGPVERYKGRTIAYSLGNWAFSHGKFFGGKLSFPPSTFHQLALELGSAEDVVHHVRFMPPSTVVYESAEPVVSDGFSLKAEFEGFSDADYLSWFKENRKKRKLLPVYVSPDDSYGNTLRDRWVAARQLAVDFAAKRGLKAMRKET